MHTERNSRKKPRQHEVQSFSSEALRYLVAGVRRFAKARDWDQFHSPKNLSMSLAIEAAEIMEHFQWLSETESRGLNRRTLAKVEDEIGDVQLYLVRLSDMLGVDPLAAARNKLRKTARKYPVARAKGSARKYTEFRTK